MAHKPRKEMIAETRAKLVSAARQAFGAVGYAEASMDDFTAAAGLTRGALYHHFGDKKGLLEAVIAEIDAEMNERLCAVSAKALNRWQGFVDESVTYIEMAARARDPAHHAARRPGRARRSSQWPNANACISSMTRNLTQLKEEGRIGDIDPEAAARLVSGASLYAAQWIANAENPAATSKKAVKAFKTLLNGLLVENK